jgi:hypothetical protein
VALAVQDELEARAQEVDRLRRQQVERARYMKRSWFNGATCASTLTTA